MEKTPLELAADMAANQLRNNRNNGNPVSSRKIIGDCANEFGISYYVLQPELTRRAQVVRENRAMKNYKKL